MDLLQKFGEYIGEHSLVMPDDKVLLAVSGGVDSMVMLSLFARSGYQIGVAHCNFQLRGPEAEEDELLVEQLAAQYGVPHYNIRFDTKGEVERSGDSVQMAARRLRYAWFDELCEKHGYTRIAIAHHADDSVETFFINLLRGTGLRGLTGIHVVNGKLIRPLLFATRKDILEYALANHIQFREDSSNLSTKYLRNKIRLGLVPRIREINPHFSEVMSSNVQRLTDAQRFIDSGMAVIRNEIVETHGEDMVIDPSRINPSLPVGFVIYELLHDYGFKGAVIDQLYAALENGDGSGKRFYSKDRIAYIDRQKIILSPISDEDSCSMEVDPRHSPVYCGNSALHFEFVEIDDVETLNVPENVALLDMERLHFPMVVRRWNDGDSFIPFGMDGRKKVSDYLVDAKVPMPDKKRQFVLISGDDIVWLVGRRIDDRYRVTDTTETVLKVTREII